MSLRHEQAKEVNAPERKGDRRTNATPISTPPKRRKRVRVSILGAGVLLIAGVWLFRVPLRDKIREIATLSNEAPAPEVVAHMIQQAADPRAALLAAWESGKIIHREVAIRSLRRVFPSDQPLPSQFESIALAGAFDPDMNVREIALGVLHEHNDPALTALAAEQLKDPDEQVRLLGLDYLKYADPAVGVPVAAALLNDSDIAVLGMTLKLLENWSGEKFGFRMTDTVQIENETTGLLEFQKEGLAKIQAAAERARVWWSVHESEFPPVKLRVPAEAYAARRPLPAPDFKLRALDGKTVRLSDYRRKVVVINFWTTWCTACAGEMPALVELQKRHSNEIVILGVSLDSVPDSHGQLDGYVSVEQKQSSNGNDDSHKIATGALQRVREKVARTVKARHINYPVLLDERNEAGGCYNGGELPTTVIVDAAGNVRRRFVGARSLPVFEAMLAQAAKPSDHEGGNP